MKKIVIIGGGTGTFTLLAGLRKMPSDNTVIVSPADDGGSTGVLRRELGVMPVGDIRQCLVGLSYTDAAVRDLFSYRFAAGSLKGHTVGNILLAAAEKTAGNIEQAIGILGKMLNIRGAVLSSALRPATLIATYADGSRVTGEHFIDEPKRPRKAGITGLALRPSLPANPRATAALGEADAIIFGPGDLFTSVIPNLLPRGMREAVAASRAKKIIVTNIMTKTGQTDGFRASDFVRALGRFLPGNPPVDAAVVNTQKPAPAILAAYRKQRAIYVEPDTRTLEELGIAVSTADLVAPSPPRAAGDRLQRSIVRHDSDKTAHLIWKLLA